MNNKSISYADAGVNIDEGNASVELMKPLVKKTFRKEVVTDLGGFGGLFALNKDKYEEPILVSGTDGVGTKLQLAFDTGIHNTIGIDAVAMCVNDILVSGAEPLFFLDYLAVGKLEPKKVAEIVEGVSEGCIQSGCALIGGETAEMPGFYKKDEYDVAGFSVGIVDKKKMIDGKDVSVDDVVIGLPSTGIHSNGFSLVRKVLFEHGGYTVHDNIPEINGNLGEVLLEPTKIYVPYVLPLVEKFGKKIKAMAHITGGGLLENIPRVLPEGMDCELDSSLWNRQPIFDLIAKVGNVKVEEMYRTFNMGIGFVLVVSDDIAEEIIETLQANDMEAKKIGHISKGNNKVNII